MQQQNNFTLVEELRDFCAKERDRIYSRHCFGIGGREVVEEYTRLADNVIQRIYQSAVKAENGRSGLPEDAPIAILALGGYGRETLNPYSDIDIMLIYNPSETGRESGGTACQPADYDTVGHRFRGWA